MLFCRPSRTVLVGAAAYRTAACGRLPTAALIYAAACENERVGWPACAAHTALPAPATAAPSPSALHIRALSQRAVQPQEAHRRLPLTCAAAARGRHRAQCCHAPSIRCRSGTHDVAAGSRQLEGARGDRGSGRCGSLPHGSVWPSARRGPDLCRGMRERARRLASLRSARRTVSTSTCSAHLGCVGHGKAPRFEGETQYSEMRWENPCLCASTTRETHLAAPPRDHRCSHVAIILTMPYAPSLQR